MNNFIVVYDKEIEDKGRDSYIKAIKKQIPDAIIADVDNLPDCTVRNVLALKPMADDTYKWIIELLEANPINDIEGAASKRLTITAEAVLRAIGDAYRKTIVIINQSEILGKSLARELLELGANVVSLNSDYTSLENLLTMTDIDVLVSASNNSDFTIDRFLTKDIKIKIDLSEDLDDPNKITRVSTIEVLKDRLENSNKWWEQNND